MLSLKNFAAVKVAVEVCNTPQLKKEILCIPGSDYDAFKAGEIRLHVRKRQWDELLELKAGIILENLGLTKELQEMVMGIILSVGLRILFWADYHENTLGFSRNYSFNFLNSSFLTTRGIVNCKKTAEGLMNDKFLSIKQKYKLALLYCMNKHIPDLYKQMTEKDKEEFYDENPNRIKQPHFVKFYSYFLKNEVDKLRGDTDPNLYWLKMAVKSGSKDVVEYCLEKTNLIADDGALIYAALEAVRNNVRGIEDIIVFLDNLKNEAAIDSSGPSVPNHYYVDVTCFLLSKMKQDTQVEFLRQTLAQQLDYGFSKILSFFLDWPYQDYFLKTVRLIWDFIPEESYIEFVRRISLKINVNKGCYDYGEEKNYDYKELLIEFLKEISKPNVRSAVRDYETETVNADTKIARAGIMLKSYLYKLKNYTKQDQIIMGLILKNASNEEKKNIISSKCGIIICIMLMDGRRWELLDDLISYCYTSKEDVDKFKKELNSRQEVKCVCIDLITNDECHAFDAFIRWSSLSDVEINQLKENTILSEHGKIACLNKIRRDKKFAAVDNVIQRCLPTQKKVIAFKKELLISPQGMINCVEFVTTDQVELVDEFMKWINLSEEEVLQYKKDVANKIGREVCEKFICNIPVYPYSPNTLGTRCSSNNHVIPLIIPFNDKKWEAVEKFLTWCFSKENEINDFKKYLKMNNAGGTRSHLTRMLHTLMRTDKWQDVEILFTWLDLSVNEARELKKETILSRECMLQIIQLINFHYFENNLVKEWDNLELILRWCLEDEGDVLEFKNRVDGRLGFRRYEDRGEYIPDNIRGTLNRFYLLINDLIIDLGQIKKNHRVIKKLSSKFQKHVTGNKDKIE